MGFAEELRRAAAPIWEAILEHPYLKELASGTLPRETFRFYVQQDWLYLQEFTRTAALTAARCPDVKEMRLLLTWAEPLVTMESHFHHSHAAELGLDFDNISWQMNETNWAYTRHMLASAYGGSSVEALAALMPCPIVYAHCGAVLAEAQPTDPLYAEWINFYAMNLRRGTNSRGERIELIEGLIDRLAEQAKPEELERAKWNYLVSSRYEWLFWDAAYRQYDWPV
ncbi:MAG: thiaminase II [Chloroflexi bacterium]|nr:thiaminase II [Chloroflexota bacterium]